MARHVQFKRLVAVTPVAAASHTLGHPRWGLRPFPGVRSLAPDPHTHGRVLLPGLRPHFFFWQTPPAAAGRKKADP